MMRPRSSKDSPWGRHYCDQIGSALLTRKGVKPKLHYWLLLSNITLDTSSRVYIGFCTSWVATLNWVITEWRSHEWWPNNVATNDVQKPLYTSEEVSNAISILQSICINIKMLYNCINFKKGIVIFAPLSLLYKLDTGKCHYVWTLTPSREQNFKWSLK